MYYIHSYIFFFSKYRSEYLTKHIYTIHTPLTNVTNFFFRLISIRQCAQCLDAGKKIVCFVPFFAPISETLEFLFDCANSTVKFILNIYARCGKIDIIYILYIWHRTFAPQIYFCI